MRKPMASLAASMAIVAVLGAGSPATAAANVVVAGPGSTATNTFSTPRVVLKKNAPANFVHLDPTGGTHNVESIAKRPDKKPWFASADITTGVAEIKGLADTPAADYVFKCRVHPLMQGTATVVD